MDSEIRRLRIVAVAITFFCILVVCVFCLILKKDNQSVEFGATFSDLYAENLQLDWQEVYIAMLDDLQIKRIRIPLYWSEIEQEDGVFDYSRIDWMMDQAESRGAKVTLVVGQKVPRWPECYLPDWSEYKSIDIRRSDLLDYIQNTVYRYKDHPALDRWQVENEPFFAFGECPSPDAVLVEHEIELVRRIDSRHQIQITTSGEQSFWLSSALQADVVGASLYREVWHENLGYFVFPLKPFFYKVQARLAGLFTEKVIISELQAEPWHVHLFTLERDSGVLNGYDAFQAEDLIENINFALDCGVDEVYFWGIEWWYYLKLHGQDGLWQAYIEYKNLQ
ncbi:endo-1,4-beta-xylanase [Patescibacteria group bacterium]|nr:endo-1,4-beta-xylanase [Patescibacteria group bacterium]